MKSLAEKIDSGEGIITLRSEVVSNSLLIAEMYAYKDTVYAHDIYVDLYNSRYNVILEI